MNKPVKKSIDKDLLFVLKEDNPYTILGLTGEEEIEDITLVYRYLACYHHPDNFSALMGTAEYEDAEAIFKKLTDAYNFLKDPEQKARFDFEQRNNKGQSDYGVTETQPGAIGEAELNMAIDQGFNPGRNLEQIIKEHNQREEALIDEKLEKISSLLKLQMFDQAVSDLQFLSDKYPGIARIHSYLGLAMLRRGWKGYARAEFKVALHLDPCDQIALANLNDLQ